MRRERSFKSDTNISPALGTLEAALFMPGCEGRFSAGARAVALSFLAPVLLFPVSALTLIKAHPDAAAFSIADTEILAALYAARLALYLLLFAGVAYMAAAVLERPREAFWRFIAAHNYLAVPPLLIAAPLLFQFWRGGYGWAEVYPVLVVVTLYGFCCLAYAAARIFRIPAELGIAFGAGALALHQGSLSALKYLFAQAALLLA